VKDFENEPASEDVFKKGRKIVAKSKVDVTYGPKPNQIDRANSELKMTGMKRRAEYDRFTTSRLIFQSDFKEETNKKAAPAKTTQQATKQVVQFNQGGEDHKRNGNLKKKWWKRSTLDLLASATENGSQISTAAFSNN
jgi:hypothetical protein